MAVKANQQYYADGEYIDKQAREFQPTMEFKNKVDSIEEGAQVNIIEDVKVNGTSLPVEDKAVDISVPLVIDNLYTVDGVNALSAKQGKVLYDLIQNLESRGRYLSNWNCATGLPVTSPETSSYLYKAGDYYIVSNVAVAGGTNYRPDGSTYVVGQASTTVETDTVNVTDLYLYDGTNWNLLINSTREIPIDPALSTTSTNPVENRVVTNAINNKQDKLIAGTNIQIANDGKTISATDTTYTAGANINIDANNEISATDTTYTAGANVQISNSNVISATDTTYSAGDNIDITNNTISATYTAGTGIDITNGVISNTQTSAEWGNITGTLSNQTDLQSALDDKQNEFHTTSTTAPSNPSEGDEWYDSTNDVLKVYDGSQWNTVSGTGDMLYADFNWVTKTGATITLDLNSEITPSANFTVNAPSTIKDGQIYVLRVINGATAYTMTLGTGITNPQSVDTTLTASGTDQFVFLAVDGGLELQPIAEPVEQCNTKTFYLSSTSDLTNAQAAYDWYLAGNNPIIYYNDTIFALHVINSSICYFTGVEFTKEQSGGTCQIQQKSLSFGRSGDTVTSVTLDYTSIGARYIPAGSSVYGTFTPTLDGHPTTKKYVDDRDTYIGTSAPSNPVEGRLWYDTTNDVLKVYDGTNWNATGKTYTAGTNISIDANNEISATDTTYTAGNGISIDANNEISVDTDAIQEKLTAGDGITIENVCTDISDMQGPAPDGFHVPLNTEWQAMYDIWTALGGGSSDGTNFGIALKLPLAGDRFRGSSSVSDQGAYGRYRSSTRTNASNAYSIHFDSSVISPQTASQRSNGLSVRCFKNSPIVPTPSWTKLYGMSIESGGIFWSSTDGLISLSSNGQTWVTIMDKNLGATTVWNSGDTLSEANCGKYYQRGNNYGFPRTGTVTTSSTQVDASAYGPGNYYSSSTFITRSSSPYRWDTTDNANLRGGVSQGSSQECALTISADTTVLATKTDLNSKQDTLVSGTNIKTINNESLLGSGDITISAPTYTAGDGIDITNNEISVDTDVIQEKLTAGTGISITGGTVCITESDRKGPAPSGFHVPSGLEWGDILNGLQLLGLSGCENAMTYLKLPMAGYREYDTTYLDNRGTVGCYWSSTPNDSTTAYILSFDGTDISSGNSITRSAGLPIRAFKNTIALPDNTWTVLNGTLGSGGVFWNQTEGLITVTGDGTTGYTIMDKNLGATQVWNYGDAEGQEETCGQTYQWGNNYGFTGDDNLVILDPSHTKRDVTGYGPTNYYSNSYWVAESPWQNSTSNGNDLWGNVSNSTHQECETTPLTISSTIEQGIISSNDTYEDVVHLTQEEYDALETKDPNTLYSTPDSGSGGGGSKGGVVGEVISFAGTTVPEDFLECDGSALSTTSYADLFAVIGYSYGGSGGTFNLPNLKGRVITGYNSSDSCFSAIGCAGGEKAHTLTINEMPSHCHGLKGAWNTSGNCRLPDSCGNYSAQCTLSPTQNAGGGQAHNNLQPYLTMKYIIRYQ